MQSAERPPAAKEFAEDTTDGALRQFAASAGESAVALQLSGCAKVTAEGFSALVQACPNTQRLWASSCPKIGAEAFATACRSCPGLTELDISRCELSARSVKPLTEAIKVHVSVCQCFFWCGLFLKFWITSGR